jgi:hypothetical protein
MRNRVGNKAETSGSFPVSEAEPKRLIASSYSLSCVISHVSQDGKGAVIHLDDLRIITGRGNITTNIDIRPGQMVVVGKTSFDNGNQALIAVLTAKIVD